MHNLVIFVSDGPSNLLDAVSTVQQKFNTWQVQQTASLTIIAVDTAISRWSDELASVVVTVAYHN